MRAIFSGQLKPGERIVETDVAVQMGVSRAPVREAIRDLVQAGLLVSVPRRGAFVISLTRKDALEIYTLRSSLECLAARLATQNVTGQDLAKMRDLVEKMQAAARVGNVETLLEHDLAFHGLIAELAQHKRLQTILQQINGQVRLFVFAATTRGRRNLQQMSNAHLGLLEALEQRDPDLAEERMRAHVASAWQELQPYL